MLKRVAAPARGLADEELLAVHEVGARRIGSATAAAGRREREGHREARSPDGAPVFVSESEGQGGAKIIRWSGGWSLRLGELVEAALGRGDDPVRDSLPPEPGSRL